MKRFTRSVESIGVLLLASVFLMACAGEPNEAKGVGVARERIIFGEDDRVEASTWTGADETVMVKASVALIPASRLELTVPTSIKVKPLSLQSRFGVCSDERFAEQPAAADCGGSLVTPDIVLTAGHCISASTCAQTKLVFDYAMTSEGSLGPISSQNVYSCAEVVVHRQDATHDYAMVRLDRSVTDRAPVPVRVGSLPLAAGSALWTIGYPSGLPQKVSANATVIDSRKDTMDYFSAHLDSLPGNSGGGVFASDSKKLVGVLVRGPGRGYVTNPGESCVRPEKAEDDSSLQVESVYVAAAVSDYCSVVDDPDFCVCGNGACEEEIGETTASCPHDCGDLCGDNACNELETADSCYADCGRCGNAVCESQEIARLSCCEDCGCPSGFSCETGSCQAQLGNLNGDAKVDGEDVVDLRAELSGCHPIPLNTRTSDVDCSGAVDWADYEALKSVVNGTTASIPCYQVGSLAIGGTHTCVALKSGNVRCWGSNTLGELGYGSIKSGGLGALNAPDLSLGGRASQVVAGRSHTCALSPEGKVKCWGLSDFGQLGYGDTQGVGSDKVPSDAGWVELSAPASKLAVGGLSSCAILNDGRVQCWGDNSFGQLGYGHLSNVGDDEAPSSQAPISFGESVVDLAVGEMHVCALTASGAVFCWGTNMWGQLGSGNPSDVGDDELASSVEPVSLGGPVKAIAVGVMHSCALLQSGQVRCWGDNLAGQSGSLDPITVGDDETPDSIEPIALGEGVVGIAAGDMHTCARYDNGNVRCWGDNSVGQLGLGSTEPVSLWTLPADVPVVEVGAPAAGLVSGFFQTCAVIASGALRCWGENSDGQLGYKRLDTIGDNEAPASAGNVPVTGIDDTGWSFVNSRAFEIWLKDDHTDSHGTSMSFLPRTPNGQPLSGLTAYMSFDVERADVQGAIELDARDRNFSSVSFEGEPDKNLLLLKFEFPGEETAFTESSRRSNYRGEGFRLGYAEGSANWFAGDDYSASERNYHRRSWYSSQRVQIVDDAGGVVYGWTRAIGK